MQRDGDGFGYRLLNGDGDVGVVVGRFRFDDFQSLLN